MNKFDLSSLNNVSPVVLQVAVLAISAGVHAGVLMIPVPDEPPPPPEPEAKVDVAQLLQAPETPKSKPKPKPKPKKAKAADEDADASKPKPKSRAKSKPKTDDFEDADASKPKPKSRPKRETAAVRNDDRPPSELRPPEPEEETTEPDSTPVEETEVAANSEAIEETETETEVEVEVETEESEEEGSGLEVDEETRKAFIDNFSGVDLQAFAGNKRNAAEDFIIKDPRTPIKELINLGLFDCFYEGEEPADLDVMETNALPGTKEGILRVDYQSQIAPPTAFDAYNDAFTAAGFTVDNYFDPYGEYCSGSTENKVLRVMKGDKVVIYMNFVPLVPPSSTIVVLWVVDPTE